MQFTPTLGALAAAALALSGCAATATKEDCARAENPNRQIGGCTVAIQSGEYSGSSLALLYTGRGLAYEKIGDIPRAVEDYDQAIRNGPNLAPTYQHRADARCRLGQPDGSVADRMEALRLGAVSARDLQDLLRREGFYRGRADGIFGPASRKALRNWTGAGCPGAQG